MTMRPDQPDQDLPRLGPEDAEAIDRLLEHCNAPGDAGSGTADANGSARAVLDLIGRGDVDEPAQGLASKTVAAVITADPVSLSHEDAVALDAVFALRARSLAAGPMPAGTRERAERVNDLLGVLDRAGGEPVPGGLAARTMQAIEADRAEQHRLSVVASTTGGRWRPSGGSIRQIVTTAALLMMVLSVLLPVLDKSQRDAMITQCEQNLAGLGVDLSQFLRDTKPSPQQTQPAENNYANPADNSATDAARVPANRVNVFVLLNDRPVDPNHFECPAGENPTARYYNGQHALAGGPLSILLNGPSDAPVFADTNPLFRLTPKGLVRDTTIPGMTRSKNHDGVGQNMLLRDGSVRWNVRPALHRGGDDPADNVWLLQRRLNNDADQPDIFLTP